MQVKQRQIAIAGQVHSYAMRRSRRAKNILLHVDHDGSIELVVPWRASYAEAEAFVGQRRRWLARRLQEAGERAKTIPRYQFVSGEAFPFLGQQLLLNVAVETSRRRAHVHQQDNRLHVAASAQENVRPAILRWYKKQARDFFTAVAPALAEQLGVPVHRIAIGSFTSQWGSANKKTGRLAFNWRLLLASEPVARYVAAHEVAHLKYPNHSAKFWSLVEQLHPTHQTDRRWLKKHEAELVI